jgi:hypothetical protein
MDGLVPAIHVFAATEKEGVDARDKPGHDEAIGVGLERRQNEKRRPGA